MLRLSGIAIVATQILGDREADILHRSIFRIVDIGKHGHGVTVVAQIEDLRNLALLGAVSPTNHLTRVLQAGQLTLALRDTSHARRNGSGIGGSVEILDRTLAVDREYARGIVDIAARRRRSLDGIGDRLKEWCGLWKFTR